MCINLKWPNEGDIIAEVWDTAMVFAFPFSLDVGNMDRLQVFQKRFATRSSRAPALKPPPLGSQWLWKKSHSKPVGQEQEPGLGDASLALF